MWNAAAGLLEVLPQLGMQGGLFQLSENPAPCAVDMLL
jgi:hypothetical protein